MLLRKLHTRLLVRKYVRGISAQRKVQVKLSFSPLIYLNIYFPILFSGWNTFTVPFHFQLQIKALTSDIFKDRKENYPQSICQPFADTRISKSLWFVLYTSAAVIVNAKIKSKHYKTLLSMFIVFRWTGHERQSLAADLSWGHWGM